MNTQSPACSHSASPEQAAAVLVLPVRVPSLGDALLSVDHRAPVRLVIVDDHELVRGCVRLLTERGNAARERGGARAFRVVAEASDTAEALLVVEREQPDVVLLDLHLPDGDGLQLLPTLMQLAPCRVIILSGWVDADVREQALRAGACEVLEKSAPPELFLRAIEHCA